MSDRRIVWLLALVLLGLGLRQVSDPDIWFYLVVAREAVATGQIPAREFYVYPALGEVAHFSAFGFGLLHYLAWRLAGLGGMALLNAALTAATFLALFQAARAATARALPAALLLLPLGLAYAVAEFRMLYRPETTLFLCLALEILVLERWLADGRPTRLLLLPVLTLAISQLHTTAVLLLAVFLAYLAHWAVGPLRRAPAAERATLLRQQLPWLVGCGLAAVLLPLINPYGLAQLTVLYRSLTALLASPDSNVEYLPIMATEYRYRFLPLAGLLAAALVLNRERRLVDLLLALAFGWLAFRFARNLALFALVAVVPLVLGLLRLQGRRPAIPGAAAAGLALALPLAGIASSGNWGPGLEAGKFPLRGAEAIRAAAPAGRILNFFHHGSYLAWALGRNYQVAMDGHFVNPTRADAYHDALFQAAAGWEETLAADRVVAIVSPATLPYSGRMIPLVAALADDPRWTLVAVEAEALTFLRQARAGGPPPLPKAEIWRQALRETEVAIRDNPDPALAMATRRLAAERLEQALGRRE